MGSICTEKGISRQHVACPTECGILLRHVVEERPLHLSHIQSLDLHEKSYLKSYLFLCCENWGPALARNPLVLALTESVLKMPSLWDKLFDAICSQCGGLRLR